MNSIDLLVMGLKNLFRRKLRTFLTALGILIGTISIVVMISLGIAMNQSLNKNIEEMGDLTFIEVYPKYDENLAMRGKQSKIKDEDIEMIKKIKGVQAVTPLLEERVKMVSGRYTADYVRVTGMDLEALSKFGYELEQGRFIEEKDKNAIIFGSRVPLNFRDPRKSSSKGGGSFRAYGGGFNGMENGEEETPEVDVMNDRILMSFDMNYGDRDRPSGERRVAPVKMNTVGLLKKKDDYQVDNMVIMDINTLKKLKSDYERKSGQDRSLRRDDEGYNNIKVKATDYKAVLEVQEELKALGFEAWSMLEYIEPMKKLNQTFQVIFGGIGAIALLVAAIGITNTMIMAIYERRKEIGVMKVIGAQIKDIKRLFLLESGMIGLLGGSIGVGLSYLISWCLNSFVAGKLMQNMGGGMGGEQPPMSVIPVWLALAALGFTAMIGLISGYLPARKAMKLSALEAIKNE